MKTIILSKQQSKKKTTEAVEKAPLHNTCIEYPWK